MRHAELLAYLHGLADAFTATDPTDADGSAAMARSWADAVDAEGRLLDYILAEFKAGEVDDEAAVSHEDPSGLTVADYAIRLLSLAKARGAFKVPTQETA